MGKSQVERVQEEIRHSILNGDYGPGAPLLERQLCEGHDTSRTTVREALFRLQNEGLVERIRGRGSFVARPSIKDLKETFEMRELIEGEAAFRAAGTVTDEQLRELRANADFSFDPEDHDSYLAAQELNMRFHLLVAESSRSELLVEFVQTCLRRLEHFLALGGHTEREFKDSHSEHHDVVDALEAGDGERAREIMRKHMRRTKDLMMRSLLEMPEPALGE